ncbi:unnamed protein product [Clonostachys solani]|uniref:Heterokaryon incompatibility domain-containing protein n=1 Tax=Clonostachys solani TaxID=160281 RepID=A0A9N9YWB2_9HYPO|nr:unnamed protein product [Clonostachys solani]
MPESLIQGGASSARDDEKLCSSHSSTALAHYLRDWANTCQKEDDAVLCTWDYSADPSGCEFCSFMKGEVDRLDDYMYKGRIRDITSFVISYQTLKDIIQQAEFDEELQDDVPVVHEGIDNESGEHHHDKGRCLVCSNNELRDVNTHNAGLLCYEFLYGLDSARSVHPEAASQSLKKKLPYCHRIIGHMEPFLRSHPESELCPVCVSISDPTVSGRLLDRFENLGLQGKRELVKNHNLPNVSTRLSPNGIQQIRVQLSNEGPWKGLILQEYEMDPKPPSNVPHFSSSGELVKRTPNVLRPAYRQPEKDVNLFIPVHDHKFGFARQTGSKFNVELMKSWITKCRYNHGEACQKQPSSKQTTNLLLVDTERYCITPIPDGPPPLYYALSYVWGNVAQPILLAKNLKAWQANGVLLGTGIPQKIRDAITLTREAGVRYLWVDALCIIEDDAKLRDEQINQMYLIYHQAEATLVAADSTDCSQGLSGVSQYGDREDMLVAILGTSVAKLPKQPKYILEASTWRTRGWTFQEEMCSLRSVIFLPGLVVFSCPTAVWREDIHLEDFDIPRLSCGLNSLPRTMGNANASAQEKVKMFRSIVKQYTQRTLTRAEDMENAFAGISGMVEDLVGPIYHGIPEHHFAQVVGGCWFWDMYCARRPGFPSWSWTGWIYTREQADAGIEPIPSLGSPEGLIQFFKFRSDAIEPMSSPVGEETDPNSWLHPDLRSHFNVELNKMQSRHAQMVAAPRGIPPGLIAFYTSLAFLSLQAPHGLSSTPIREFRVLHPQTKRQMTSISLPEYFVELHGALHPFVIIAACEEANGRDAGGMRLMLVEMEGGMCYKVNVTSPRKVIREEDWLGLNPTKKLVIMA